MNKLNDSRGAGPGVPPWQRRLFHAVAGSILPVVAFFVSEPLPAILAGALALVGLALDLLRFRVAGINRLFLRHLRLLLKSKEDSRITGATYLLIGSCITFVLFDPMVAIAALLFLSLGDPAAAIVGQSAGGPRFFGKSPVGTLAFIVVASLVAAVLVFVGGTQVKSALFAGAVVAAVVEILPLPVDDNLTIPLAAGAVIQYSPLLF